MSTEAWNKIEQTHDLFKKIVAPLKQHLGINFGYMIVFKDGSYYQIIENLECLKKWITNVETSHIFCARNVTTYFDDPYNFTIWPEEPTCTAMEIYKEYGMWNGITVSKQNKDYTELYWFTKQNTEVNWHKWFIRNKQFLLDCVSRFNCYKESLNIFNRTVKENLFCFKSSFNSELFKSEYINNESSLIHKLKILLKVDEKLISNSQTKIILSSRELEVLYLIGHGYYTAKSIAQDLNITPRTAQFHIDNIKRKTNFNNKIDLAKLYNSAFI